MASRDPNGPVGAPSGGRLKLKSTEGSRWLIELGGELDITNAHLLNQEHHLAEMSDATAVVVDLSRFSFMDSSGLHVLLRAFDREPERLRLRPAVDEHVQSLFRLTGMEERLPFERPVV